MNEDLRESLSLGTGYGEPVSGDEACKSLNTSTLLVFGPVWFCGWWCSVKLMVKFGLMF